MAYNLGTLLFEDANIEKDFICYVCDRTFSRLGFLKAHFQRTHPNSTFPSSLLTKNPFNNPPSSSKKKHSAIFTKEDSSHVCDKCNKSFQKKIELLKHGFIHRQFNITSVTKCSPTVTYTCEDCKKLMTQPECKKHFIKCELCSSKHCVDWLYKKEFCKKGKDCMMCKRELCNNCHKLHTTSEELVEKTHECVVCKELFASKKQVKDHYASAHAISKLAY